MNAKANLNARDILVRDGLYIKTKKQQWQWCMVLCSQFTFSFQQPFNLAVFLRLVTLQLMAFSKLYLDLTTEKRYYWIETVDILS
jgi:hypothetical protein